jgi:hypothetical protein
MDIAVLGSGNGGCAVAFDCAAHGHRVRLFDFQQFPDSIKAVQNNGGISCEGVLEGFQPVVFAGHEIEKALDGADIIYAVGPAYSTRPFAEACRPHLERQKEAPMEDFKRILYPVALTEISPKVAPYVVTLARQLDAQVHLLHVLRRFDWFVDTYVSDPPKPDFKRIASDFESQVLSQAQQKLEAFHKSI